MKMTEITKGFRRRPLARLVYWSCYQLMILIDYTLELERDTRIYKLLYGLSEWLLSAALWLYRKKL